jgi:hypothetical protein
MDQPNILENILSFLDGKNLFIVRQVSNFWKDECEYLLKKLDFIECKWYQTHLVFLNAIDNDESINTRNIPNGWYQYTHFFVSCGVLMDVYEILGNHNVHKYEIVFKDYMKTTFSFVLFEKHQRLRFCIKDSFDMKSIKMFVGSAYNYSDYEYDISFFPKFIIKCASPRNYFYQFITNANQFISPCVKINKEKNDRCQCENDSEFGIEIKESTTPNIFDLIFTSLDRLWMRIDRVGENQYVILRGNTYPQTFLLEFTNERTKLLKIKDFYFNCGFQYVFCPLRKQLIQFKFEKSHHKLKRVVRFYEPSQSENTKTKTRKIKPKFGFRG